MFIQRKPFYPFVFSDQTPEAFFYIFSGLFLCSWWNSTTDLTNCVWDCIWPYFQVFEFVQEVCALNGPEQQCVHKDPQIRFFKCFFFLLPFFNYPKVNLKLSKKFALKRALLEGVGLMFWLCPTRPKNARVSRLETHLVLRACHRDHREMGSLKRLPGWSVEVHLFWSWADVDPPGPCFGAIKMRCVAPQWHFWPCFEITIRG